MSLTKVRIHLEKTTLITMTTRVRFAPSPTGSLHIGSVRTALFNWLYARHTKGKFLLRIEDTDLERSTQANTQLILDSLKWLGLDWDDEPIIQSSNAERHKAVALQLLESGKAYKCYHTKEELEQGIKSQYRHQTINDDSKPYVIRFKTPEDFLLTLFDKVQGKVEVNTKTIEDVALLRADGTPTYMLSVVVDDHDMGITQVIRGDDHLTNTFKQILIYNALGWGTPHFAHIPLIHDEEGKKLSKRHGATSVDYYKETGILPEAFAELFVKAWF